LENAHAVVELGPGTGAFTRVIVERIGKKTTFIALELDERNVTGLRRRFPGLHAYHDSAENIRKYLARHNRRKADVIISGLPFGNLLKTERDRILNAVFAALKPGGSFVALAYKHAGWFPSTRAFRRRLEAHFKSVTLSPIVWNNLPPAIVYRCT
jgi:phosphatidylethanolamine/phosphatidyl-N-methylethanolamine N-methyltransferase